MKHLTRVVAFVALIALAACGQAPPIEPQAQSIAGTVVSPDPTVKFQGAALLMMDPDALAPADVIEIVPGAYSSAMTPIAADGSFELPLPTAEELPANLLQPATGFIRAVDSTCELAASVPSAKVTQYLVGAGPAMIVPAVYVMGIFGSALTVVTPTAIDFDDPGLEIYDLQMVSWLYADADVAVTSPDGGCITGSQPLFVDLDLEKGWNQVVLRFVTEPGTVPAVVTEMNVSNGTFEDLYFNAIGGL